MSQRHVLIVGGGFAGVKAALELAGDERFRVTLLSNRSHFRYYPSLYHAATGGQFAQSNIALETIFEDKAVQIVLGEAQVLERKSKYLKTADSQKHHYDILILALGVVTNYFGINGLKEFSYSIKSLEEAERFKRHLHQQLVDFRKPDLNYVIVGGGPTGIELAGALPGYLKNIVENHGIKTKKINIDLIEAAPHLMPRMPSRMAQKIERQIKSLGIKLYLNQAVQGETADSLVVNGQPIASRTVVWTAGVTNHPFFKANDFGLSDHGKVVVDDYLQAEPNIFVLGDNANTEYSGMAQTAIYDAEFLAHILKRKLSGKKSPAYKPKKPIYVTPAGPEWAAVLWGKVQIYGRLGWSIRELADADAFRDMEPWRKASKQWLTEFGSQESCPECAHLV
ncbi:MAG: NAD(P)/FAD-dependent oxidoreductase [Candidatus Saccharimonadales bacterium]